MYPLAVPPVTTCSISEPIAGVSDQYPVPPSVSASFNFIAPKEEYSLDVYVDPIEV